MKKGIIILLIGVATCLYSFNVAESQEKNSEVIEISRIFLERQKAFKEKDYEKLWEFFPYREDLRGFVDDPKNFQMVCEEKITNVILITPKRAFIEVTPSGPLGGYYLIKKNEKWVFNVLYHHYLSVWRELKIISQQIKEFYERYEILPQDIEEIVQFYPEIENRIFDSFDDEKNPYRFLISDGRWKLYSIGPDSKDDGGTILYNPADGLISEGDIVFSDGYCMNEDLLKFITKFGKLSKEH